MSRTLKRYHTLLKPLREVPAQVYLGKEIHLAGLLSWILDQTGQAEVIVTTFSTSDDFLCAFRRLRDDGLIKHAVLVADFKASQKTKNIRLLMKNSFDRIFFAENHSKLMLVRREDMTVTVITSQNQTYGGRNESTFITADNDTYWSLHNTLFDIIQNHSVESL